MGCVCARACRLSAMVRPQAFHVRAMAEQYGVPVILHTDHCAKNLLPWLDGMLLASERYYAAHGEPLFSSHMLDLSEEPLDENLEICVEYMERMAKMDMLLEMELGITGGEEDGVNNEDVAVEDLYTKVTPAHSAPILAHSLAPYLLFAASCFLVTTEVSCAVPPSACPPHSHQNRLVAPLACRASACAARSPRRFGKCRRP